VNHVSKEDRVLGLAIGRNAREAKEEELLEAVDAFIYATKGLLHLSCSWLATKKKVAANRGQELKRET
jgi:hypothetical protein